MEVDPPGALLAPQTTRKTLTEFVTGPFLPADAAAAAAPAPDTASLPGAPGGGGIPPALHPPTTAHLPVEVLAASNAKLTRGAPGLAGEEGERVLRAVFGERLPWQQLYE